MKIDLIGKIKSRGQIRIGKDDCYGLTRVNGNKFSIYLSKKALTDGYILSETMLHELLHLWFFIINGALKREEISEKDQHEILEYIIPIVLGRTDLILKRRKNEKNKN